MTLNRLHLQSGFEFIHGGTVIGRIAFPLLGNGEVFRLRHNRYCIGIIGRFTLILDGYLIISLVGHTGMFTAIGHFGMRSTIGINGGSVCSHLFPANAILGGVFSA